MLNGRMAKLICCSILFLNSHSFASEPPNSPIPKWFDIKSYQLTKEMKEDTRIYKLKTPDGTLIEVPLETLEPAGEREEEAEDAISSFEFDAKVSAFPANENQTILHIWSFDAMTEGSMWLAKGRDVFLLLENESKDIHDGGFDLE